MLAYRIIFKTFAKELIAPGTPGRWNSSGRKVIYCAESIALAFLENMVRRQGVGFNDDFKTMILKLPDELPVQVHRPADLPGGWRNFSNYSLCQPLGDNWHDEGTHPILKVPSAVLPESFNFVLNAAHADFKKIKLIAVTDLIPDERIEDLLKGQKNKKILS